VVCDANAFKIGNGGCCFLFPDAITVDAEEVETSPSSWDDEDDKDDEDDEDDEYDWDDRDDWDDGDDGDDGVLGEEDARKGG